MNAPVSGQTAAPVANTQAAQEQQAVPVAAAGADASAYAAGGAAPVQKPQGIRYYG